MSLRKRIGILVIVDSFIVLTAIYISNFFLNPNVHLLMYDILLVSSVALLTFHHIFSWHYKLYKKAWEYASVRELIAIFKAVSLSILMTGAVQLIVFQDIALRTLTITFMLHILLIGGSRFSWRVFRDRYLASASNQKRTLVVGAGAAGTMVVRQLINNKEAHLQPVAFVDDDLRKQHLEIHGVPVLGGIHDIAEIVKEREIENIVIAIPSLSKKELNEIFQECTKTSAKTKILPMIEDLMEGNVSVNSFRDVQVEDLLGREPVQLDNKGIAENLSGKVVLVTGAGGSIGSEICRQVSKFKPAKLILLGHGENSIYTIEMELLGTISSSIEIVTEIADVQDRDKMFDVMDKYKPDVVYHAAAHKHVPLMERNPEAAVKNNVIGTKNVAEAASSFGVGSFVMVSTDKAVNPTSVMGASKRLAEMIVQNMDAASKTRFVAVRFGNVLGSRGSVIPLFKKQIEKGGPVTVTHPDMVRYFMTIPEASRLVIQAGVLAKGGEIFVLDMGDPVKIVDLASNLIKLSGHLVEDIGIKFTGIRPGEKMFEELLGKNEVHDEQVYPKIYVGKTSELYMEEIENVIREFGEMEPSVLRETLLELGNRRVEKVRVSSPSEKRVVTG
ncbi:nucleoside-diphosphate sugar epimerase/dehydratase [Bacillaceae bacterium S4-13-58]